MSNSTPGPWEYDGKFTVGIPHKDGWTYFRTNPEDARLIAAAPELLEAAHQVEAQTHYGSRDDPYAELPWETVNAVIAAIAKATNGDDAA